MLPNKDKGCHRCNFEKKCRDLVSSEQCDRWKKMPWKYHPLSGEPGDEYGCIDDLVFGQLLDMQRQIGMTTIEMNQMRNEFKTSHDANLAIGAAAVQRARDAVQDAMHQAVQPLADALVENQCLAGSSPPLLIAAPSDPSVS